MTTLHTDPHASTESVDFPNDSVKWIGRLLLYRAHTDAPFRWNISHPQFETFHSSSFRLFLPQWPHALLSLSAAASPDIYQLNCQLYCVCHRRHLAANGWFLFRKQWLVTALGLLDKRGILLIFHSGGMLRARKRIITRHPHQRLFLPKKGKLCSSSVGSGSVHFFASAMTSYYINAISVMAYSDGCRATGVCVRALVCVRTRVCVRAAQLSASS